jgi:hypothetical protein
MTRGILVSVAVLALTCSIAGAAFAGETNYYGFNYLSPSLPNDKCAPYVGRACSGYNYWDQSRLYKNSGDVVRLGFQDTTGGFYFLDFDSSWNNVGEIQLTRGAVGAPSYTRDYCKYQSGNSSYVKCLAYIAP